MFSLQANCCDNIKHVMDQVSKTAFNDYMVLIFVYLEMGLLYMWKKCIICSKKYITCQPYRMGHRQHLNQKMDMDGFDSFWPRVEFIQMMSSTWLTKKHWILTLCCVTIQPNIYVWKPCLEDVTRWIVSLNTARLRWETFCHRCQTIM